VLENGRLALFRNYDEYGNRLGRPRTLLIDSEQLDWGEKLDDDFRRITGDAIERFRREIVARSGDRHAGDKISDQDLLREVMNTVGRPGQLGDSIRCVVSVAMLTEGWDANTVTHILGIRAFGTQLLCEQVVGRGLRRQSYELDENGLLPVDYADVLGIPFDFTAKPVVAKPVPPRETVGVHAVRPDRDPLEIRFPRVEGHRVDLPDERLTADFGANSVLELTPQLVGPSITENRGIIGEGVELTLAHLRDMRPSTILFHLARRLLLTKFRDPGEEPRLHLVEIKGYRGEDAKDKANTMDSYWVPGVNNLGTSGRWAFAEFKESVYAIAANFGALIERAVAVDAPPAAGVAGSSR
jgi:type III restriction enzyme